MDILPNQFVNEFIDLMQYPIGAPRSIIQEWEVCLQLVKEFEEQIIINQELTSTRYCKTEIYQKELKQARKVARLDGYKIIQRNLPVNWEIGPHISGSFHTKSNNIYLRTRGKNGKFGLLYVLYHELRHLQHYLTNTFPDYYTNNSDNMIDYCYGRFEGKFPPLCSPYISFAAEVDCDLYAIRRMNEKGFRLPDRWKRLYSPNMVCTISLFTYLLYTAKQNKRADRLLKSISKIEAWGYFVMNSKVF